MAPRWLAAGIACIAAGAAAQASRPLDLSYRAETKGTVVAIREVSAAGGAPTPAKTPAPASGSSLDQGPLVGAVAYVTFDAPSDNNNWRVGAVGQGDMQPWLTDHAKEIVVAMDDGERRTFRPRHPERFQLHDRVSVQGGAIEPLRAAN